MTHGLGAFLVVLVVVAALGALVALAAGRRRPEWQAADLGPADRAREEVDLRSPIPLPGPRIYRPDRLVYGGSLARDR